MDTFLVMGKGPSGDGSQEIKDILEVTRKNLPWAVRHMKRVNSVDPATHICVQRLPEGSYRKIQPGQWREL